MVAATLVVTGCAVKKPEPVAAAAAPQAAASPKPVACTPVAADSPLVGTWYSVSTPRGVAGNLQTLTVLTPDGRMTYQTQLKIGKKVRPALSEAGCWTYTDGVYTMQTTTSYGEPVDIGDPIYRNRYQVEKIDGKRAQMRELKPNGQLITATRVASSYRLP
ncbi:hypothetical protein C7R54_24600 [Achromobacter aloeverae]|uniref:Lipocalin-like domain-containing protein n=2 Tax=Achromobacter aloeverae TaxID=1750518 RepID=A0A4Q1HE68_9BURK|nr:hypothetical protein [Achromobacter aloeverae]RXN84553.1 hypothetical protein C7R54_24600 [Achromobacter aloeverae]